jgi:ssDNA thymidine ADP-ribosyltransferase DarT-like protein
MASSRRIYHITHLKNLAGMLAAGALFSDHRVVVDGDQPVVIGFDHIKERRMRKIVHCHPHLHVGDFVPFYFCPRSIMLYVIEKRNSELTYRGGQREIVHLVSDVDRAVCAAGGRAWAFTDGNASTAYTNFYNDLSLLPEVVDWNAVNATMWSDPAIKEKKQAEFLVQNTFPWSAVMEIGVFDQSVAETVREIVGTVPSPSVGVQRAWYY